MIPETQSLREELSRTRHTVIQLMPQPIRDVLQTYYDCQTMADHRQAEQRVTGKAEPVVRPVPHTPGSISLPR